LISGKRKLNKGPGASPKVNANSCLTNCLA
jgi:hypothetical protein